LYGTIRNPQNKRRDEMKKSLLSPMSCFAIVFCCLLITSIPYAFAGPVGFASMNGGTTGGEGGNTITVTNGADLYAALKDKQDSSTPLTIRINGTITPGNTGESKIDVKDVEDVTLIGVGSGAEFDGIGIKVTRSHNIIIQNLIIHEVDTGDKDGISIEGASTNIWIDHNEIYASLDVDKDHYDGLLDTKRDSEYITISYNYLHHSWKTSLHGSSDNDSGDRYITFHHNRFENLYSRVPLFRYGRGHLFNNYFYNIIDTGINSRMGALLRIENNHFESSKNPVVSFYSDEIGYWDLRDNLLENVTWEESSSSGIIAGDAMESTTSYTPPYNYTLDDVNCVRETVKAAAGAGTNLATTDGTCSVDTEPGDGTDTGDNTDPEDDANTGEDYSELGTNLAISAGSDGSSKTSGTSYKHVRDDDQTTYWQPKTSSDERVSIKWSDKTAFNTVVIRELTDAVTSWQLINNDSGNELSSGNSIGSKLTVYVGDVTMKKINLIIDSATSAPQIAEIEIYKATSNTNDDADNGTDDNADNDTDDDADNDTDDETAILDEDIVLSPSSSTTLQEAIDSIQPGNTIYLREGTYRYSSSIIIAEGNNGRSNNFKNIAAYGDGQPVLDFSEMSFGSSNRGVILAGNYWKIKGIKIQRAGDNGMLIAGHNNIIDNCEFYANRDTGLQLSRYNTDYDDIDKWPSNNIIRDCYSHSNYDPDDGEDADGFAPKLTCGEGNEFIRCVAKYNVDDGWDLYTKSATGKIGSVYFEDCEASHNGETESGQSTNDSDGNGFKLGGSKIAVDHKLVNCRAYNNKKHGITANSNRGDITLINCDASGNGGEDFKDVSNQ
jgi:pectate lyase